MVNFQAATLRTVKLHSFDLLHKIGVIRVAKHYTLMKESYIHHRFSRFVHLSQPGTKTAKGKFITGFCTPCRLDRFISALGLIGFFKDFSAFPSRIMITLIVPLITTACYHLFKNHEGIIAGKHACGSFRCVAARTAGAAKNRFK